MTEDRDTDVGYDVTGFVAELRRLADALESAAAFTIHVDGEDVTIPEDAMFSVSHEREDGEVELEFQVTWSHSEASDAAEEDEAEEVAAGTGEHDAAATAPEGDEPAGPAQA